MKDLKVQLDNLVKTVQQDNEILALFLFGSMARGDNHKASDADICLVLSPRRYLPLELSEKKLEYLKLFDMDVQIFQQLPIYIRMRIIKEAKLLFCAAEEELYQIVFNTITEFEDYAHIYRDYLKEIANVG